jgi:hypothetical protein
MTKWNIERTHLFLFHLFHHKSVSGVGNRTLPAQIPANDDWWLS